jgi:hypothetical protein
MISDPAYAALRPDYIIYYREARGRPHILRVIHAKRDQKSAFFEKPH